MTKQIHNNKTFNSYSKYLGVIYTVCVSHGPNKPKMREILSQFRQGKNEMVEEVGFNQDSCKLKKNVM